VLTEAATPSALEERKVVTVLFCDLVGFTAASERQDPEDVRARIRPYHARLRTEIEGYGGTVEKFVGDAVMAAFGAPVAHEDDAERAVRAGLAILDAITELNEAEPGLELQVRVGINSGEALVALGAHPERGEGIVTGDVVNTAARIEGAAPVGAVAVGEQTYRATSRVFDYEPLPPVSVKGKSEPVSLWRANAARSRFGTDVTRRYTTPLVGRELEKPLLIGTFERAAQQRSVQLVTVVGEPGVGKSRLAAELFAYVETKPELTRWRQGRCLPYGEGITFWALGEIVKAEAGILESDSAQVAEAKLAAAIADEDAERAWLQQRLSPLVGVDASPAERPELFTAWRRFLEGLAAARPTVLVFEDLHWADEALLAFLEHLAEWAEGVPLLVLCTARPELYERYPGWTTGVRNATTINLQPLSDAETAELVSNLIASTVLSPEVQDGVLERAGGNPLYAEEFVRLLGDRGLGAGDTELPESLQALIAARLDTLSADRKSLLQDAAVLGKVFWAGALAEIGGRDQGELELALHDLARKELVRSARASSMEGEAEYSFWHLLVRDVAYSQIPRAERARRHRSAAAWIERKAGDRVEDFAELLAHHNLQALELAAAAGDTELAAELAPPARRFLTLAGERALYLDTEQAVARLTRALELTATDDPERAKLLLRWGEAAVYAGRLREGADALEEALTAFRARRDTEGEAEALIQLSRVSFKLGDGRMVQLAFAAVALLEQQPPGPLLVEAYAQLATSHFLAGAHHETIAAADRSIALAEQLDVPESPRALAMRGNARAELGDADGIAEMERALALYSKHGGGIDSANIQNNLAITRYPLEGPARSLATFEAAVAFCRQRGFAVMAAQLEDECTGLLAELGRPAEGLELAGRLVAVHEATGNTHGLTWVRAFEVATRGARGEDEAAPGLVAGLVESAAALSANDVTVEALAAAAAAELESAPEESRRLLALLDQTPGGRRVPIYARRLPLMLRVALTAGDAELARRLAGGIEFRYPLHQHALCTARAQLAEHEGDQAGAAELYRDAAARWHQFGNVSEHAYALLGEGRCLSALGDPAAEHSLRNAAELFASMGYRPALAETEALLERVRNQDG